MIKRGILNSKALYWVHLHPRDYALYWYETSIMHEFIKKTNPPIWIGHSKDPNHTPTGKIYLIPKRTTPFVVEVPVPKKIIDWFPWVENGQFVETTDREAGAIYGEAAMDWILSIGCLRLPIWSGSRIRDKNRQYDSMDYQLAVRPSPSFELKTELVKSDNLAVQTHEGGHRVVYTHSGKRRITKLDGFEQKKKTPSPVGTG